LGRTVISRGASAHPNEAAAALEALAGLGPHYQRVLTPAGRMDELLLRGAPRSPAHQENAEV